MHDFEKSCPLQTLMEEGTALNTEVHEFDFNLDKYEKAQKNLTRLSLLCKSKIENRQHNTECKDIDNFHALVAVTGNGIACGTIRKLMNLLTFFRSFLAKS